MSIRVCIAGITGWTGTAIAAGVAEADDLELTGGVSRSDPRPSFDSRRGARGGADRRSRRLHARLSGQGQRAHRDRPRRERGDRLERPVGRRLRGDRRARSRPARRRRRLGKLLTHGRAHVAVGTRGGAPSRRLGDHRLRERQEDGRAERDRPRARRAARRGAGADDRRPRRRGARPTAAPAARRSPAYRSTRSGSRASSSRRRSCSRRAASGCRSATTRARHPPHTSRARCSRSAPYRGGSASPAGSTTCSSRST